MNNKFNVGEVVVLKSIKFPEHNGTEMTITSTYVDGLEIAYATDFLNNRGGYEE